MPPPKTVTPRMVALQYDGSNSADILAMANADMASAVYTVASEAEGTLVLASSQPSYWSDLTFAVGDYCLVPNASVVAESMFPGRFVVLGDA